MVIRNSKGTGFRIPENSKILYGVAHDTLVAEVKAGGFLSLGKFQKPLKVRTQVSTAAVRGTIFYVHQEEDHAYHCTCQTPRENYCKVQKRVPNGFCGCGQAAGKILTETCVRVK